MDSVPKESWCFMWDETVAGRGGNDCHRSIPAKNKLMKIEEQMNISSLKLKQEVTTRWNSTYDMLMRFLRVKDPLIATLYAIRNNAARLRGLVCDSKSD